MDDRIRVLYAEDDPGDAELTRRRFALDAPECDLDIAHSGRACLDRLAQHDYDLLLLDSHLPDMNGLDIVSTLMRQGVTLPVVLITEVGDEDVAIAALRSGAYDYIVKTEGYLTHLPHVIDNAIARFHLDQTASRLRAELEALTRSLKHKVPERTAALEQEGDECKRTEATLHESERQYREFLTHLPVAAYVTDTTGRITLHNDAAVALWGRRPDPGDRWWGSASKLYTPDGAHLPHSQCPMVVAIRENRSFYNFEVIAEQADGTQAMILANIRPVKDASGRVLGATNVIVDITGRTQAEAALLARVGQQAAVAEIVSVALSDAGTDQVLNRVVAMIASVLDVELCNVLELLPDHSALLVRAGVGWQAGVVGQATVPTDRYSQAGYTLFIDEPVIVQALRTETRFQGSSLLLDHGVVSGLSVKIVGPNGPFGVLGAHTTRLRTFTADDVHFLQAMANVLANMIARKQAETSLAGSQQLQSLILESVEDGIHGMDLDGRILFESPAALKMFGWRAEEMIGQHAHTLIHHHHADGRPYPVEECPLYRTVRDGQVRHVHNEVYFRQDGTSFPVEYTVSALREDAGALCVRLYGRRARASRGLATGYCLSGQTVYSGRPAARGARGA
jgi:PAS domain S-box-containing protein